MTLQVVWTDEAIETFEANLNYLRSNWPEDVATRFLHQVDSVVKRLLIHPESYPPGVRSKAYRRARLNKYIVLFYKFQPRKKRIILLTFWHSRQNPSTSKYF
jgi:plasmid stabilization system protein ParE